MLMTKRNTANPLIFWLDHFQCLAQRSWSGLCCLQCSISCLHYITLHYTCHT